MTSINRTVDDRFDARVQARHVAAACQDSDSHTINLLNEIYDQSHSVNIYMIRLGYP